MKLIILVSMMLCLTVAAYAEDSKYMVMVEIKYNSIPAHVVADLIEDQLRKHKDACEVRITVTKPDAVIDAVTQTYLTWDTSASGTTVTLEVD